MPSQDDKILELPEWMIEKIYEAYASEVEAMMDDPYLLSLVPGWYGDKLDMTVVVEERSEKRFTFSLERICDEPAKHWHVNGVADSEHYRLIGEIAERLREQSDRLFAVQKSLKVRD